MRAKAFIPFLILASLLLTACGAPASTPPSEPVTSPQGGLPILRNGSILN